MKLLSLLITVMISATQIYGQNYRLGEVSRKTNSVPKRDSSISKRAFGAPSYIDNSFKLAKDGGAFAGGYQATKHYNNLQILSKAKITKHFNTTSKIWLGNQPSLYKTFPKLETLPTRVVKSGLASKISRTVMYFGLASTVYDVFKLVNVSKDHDAKLIQRESRSNRYLVEPLVKPISLKDTVPM